MRVAGKGGDDHGSAGDRGGAPSEGIQPVHRLQFRVQRVAVGSDRDLGGCNHKGVKISIRLISFSYVCHGNQLKSLAVFR